MYRVFGNGARTAPLQSVGDFMAKADLTASVSDSELFELRWRRAERDLMTPLTRLYGGAVKPATLRRRVRDLLAEKWKDRPADLRALDMARDVTPDWFQSQAMAGYVFYVDRFTGDMKGVAAHIPYLQSLGIRYAHFMPCLKPRPGDSDGGYAVVDYGKIDPKLGSMGDFKRLAKKLRKAGISPCIDMVLNHTAREHDWAVKARRGDAFYQAFYRLYDDATIPLQFEKTLL
jgi:amylosucrase